MAIYRDQVPILGLKLKTNPNGNKPLAQVVPFHEDYCMIELKKCQFCLRSFLPQILTETHSLICKSVFLGKRTLFNSGEQRGLLTTDANVNERACKPTVRGKLNLNWREIRKRFLDFLKFKQKESPRKGTSINFILVTKENKDEQKQEEYKDQ